MPANEMNLRYLETKKTKLGHLLDQDQLKINLPQKKA
jgi:hypothetical protein